MKIAIAVDDLIQRGGQEVLFEAVTEIWPHAEVFTSVASSYWRQRCREKNIKLNLSFLQKFPFAEKFNRYYSPFLLHALAFESFDFSDFDVVLSISSRYAHMLKTKPNTLHIVYMNSPGRMFWEPAKYFENENYGILKPLKFLSRPFLNIPLSYLRVLDFSSAQKVDYFIANSKNIKQKILKYYKRDAEVIYPFFDQTFSEKTVTQEFYLIVTRLLPWKRVDYAIEACTKHNVNLKVIGRGPDLDRLKKIAGPTVEFPSPDQETKIKLLESCKALIHPQEEDFGIVPLEAMACGKPVIAFGKGGILETVINGKTGVFFDDQSPESLYDAIRKSQKMKFEADECINQADKFRKAIFQQSLLEYVRSKYENGL